MKKIIEWFAGNHVAANLLMLFFLIGGILSTLAIKVEFFPDVEPDEIRIIVSYPGASPEEVEEGVIRPIEERVAGLAGVERVTSTAKEGEGIVSIEVVRGWNTDELLQNVKSEVDRITNLPEEAERPIVQKVVRRYPVVSIAIYGDVPESTLKKLGEELKSQLEELPEITEVRLYAVRPAEIHIEIPEENLRRYHLTLEEVAQIIKRESVNFPAGEIKTNQEEILIRGKGKLIKGADYGNIVIVARPDGSKIRLKDIATIKDEFRDDWKLAGYFQGKRAVIVQVFRIGNQNDFRISKAVQRYFPIFKSQLPEGVKAAIYFDTTTILKERLTLLLKNLAIGMVLVVLILGLFMNLRISFWVTMGIPVAFAFALFLLPYFDVSINMISLFGFILVLGMVVDDAIVIGENVYRRRELGDPPLEAAINGTIEMTKPVAFAVLTTMAAFYPLLLGTGAVGKVVRQIPIVVILVLTGSIIEALFVLPSHLAGSKFKVCKEGEEKFIPKMLNRFISGPFVSFLKLCLRWRYTTIAVFCLILFISLGLWIGGRVKTVFFPKVEADQIDCYLTMPAGTPMERTLEVARKLEKAAKEVIPPSVFKYTLTMLGVHMVTHGPKAGAKNIAPNLAQITVRLVPAEKRRGISAVELAKKWRDKVGNIPDAESLVFQSELFSLGKDIEVNLYLDNEKLLIKAVNEFKKILRHYPGVYNISDNFLPGKKEIQIKLKPSARELGLSLQQVAKAVRDAFYGAEALRFQRGRDEVRVLVRYPKRERQSLSQLFEMRIKTPLGKMVPLKEIADIKFARSYVALHRTDLKRVITVSADVDEKIANANDIRKEIAKKVLPELKKKYPGLGWSFEGEGKEHRKAFKDVERAFMLALFLIYALLAVPLRSFSKPIIIMSAIPFGIIGAFWGHVLFRKPLCILSMFGIVGLAGVAVNDALILVDAIDKFRKEASSLEKAVIQATVRRFRPIILTTLTTFVGLIPMITEKSLQAQFLIPMAISLGFGVLFATFITLILVPCGYLVLEDFKVYYDKIINK